MNIVIFDTENIALTKPFCYNVGYVIFDTDTHKVLHTEEFIVEQVWHNKMLFATAHYTVKRQLYVRAMRGKVASMHKFGMICRHMTADFNKYEVKYAYAYNGKFDENAFQFNCDWFKCRNPFDNIDIIDIAGNVCETIAKFPEYSAFCEKNQLFTEKGNYSLSAESVYKYITQDPSFQQAHTALLDSVIECDILIQTLNAGCKVGEHYKKTHLTRSATRKLIVTIDDCKKHVFDYCKKVERKAGIFLYTKK